MPFLTTKDAKMAKRPILSIFGKVPKSPFWEASISCVFWRIELKFMWGLSPTLKSSHIKFELNPLENGGDRGLSKWPKRPFGSDQGLYKQIFRNLVSSRKRHFWGRTEFLRVARVLFSQFWPRTCFFKQIWFRNFLIFFEKSKFHFLKPWAGPRLGKKFQKIHFPHVFTKTCF